MPKPLSGRVVVVTRPRGQAASFARDLRASGARVVLAPAIRLAEPASHAALDAALSRLDGFDAAVFTSANAVRRFFGRGRALRLGRLKPPAGVFAVGPETARALRTSGWRPRPLPAEYRAEGLARALGAVKGLRVLLPRAEEGREELPRLLRRRGARVTLVEAYRTLPDPGPSRRLRARAARGALDAVAFASPSAARGFVSGLGRARAVSLFKTAAAASIGPVTSRALRRLGIAPRVEAERATSRDLLRALERHFAGRRKGGGR